MEGIHIQPVGERISINCIAYLAKDFPHIQNINTDDENIISTVIPQIIKRKNMSNESKEKKKIVIDSLVDNMKKVYKSLDLTKINKNNYQSIFNQFNNICLDETDKKLNIAFKVKF
jgi:hypothetical protein